MTAFEVGHEYLVLTDHSPRLTVANGLSAARLAEQLDVVAAVDSAPRRRRSGCCTGIEVDILDDGALDQTDEMLGPARRRRRLGALQAEDGRRGDDPADGRRGPAPARPTCSGTAPAG